MIAGDAMAVHNVRGLTNSKKKVYILWHSVGYAVNFFFFDRPAHLLLVSSSLLLSMWTITFVGDGPDGGRQEVVGVQGGSGCDSDEEARGWGNFTGKAFCEIAIKIYKGE